MEQATNRREAARRALVRLSFFAAIGISCARTSAVESSGPTAAPATPLPSAPSTDAGRDAQDAEARAVGDAPTEVWVPRALASIDGPHEELSLDAGRSIWYAMPRRAPLPLRLVGHLHGMCGPPSYACGKWISAGTDIGAMVCPTGNARCGDSPIGPPSWEAPSWTELVALMDKDLETAVAKVAAKHPGSIRRDGAVLTGYSRGAYAAPLIARAHPHRWPYLVLIEANVPLSAPSLRSAGVRAVAFVGGEQGNEIAGMQKTVADLTREGYPAKLVVMRRTGHLYSDDMERVMHDALAFVLAREGVAEAGAP